MRPVYQTRFGRPNGNCLQACIASLFELPLESVPPFVQKGDDWYWELDRFCRLYGLAPVFLSRDLGGVGRSLEGQPGGWWSIVTGQSPRGSFRHSVVAYNGRIVHDPYPGGNGELVVVHDEIVFVQLDPALALPSGCLPSWIVGLLRMRAVKNEVLPTGGGKFPRETNGDATGGGFEP